MTNSRFIPRYDVFTFCFADLHRMFLGDWSSKPYAISLLASGQSSTVTGLYAGQYIMQTNLKLALLFSPRGFLGMKMELWLRNLITRFIAIAPSLLACIIGGSSGPARLIIIASVMSNRKEFVKSSLLKQLENRYRLPFAWVPLLRFTSSAAKMGCHKNSIPVTLITWLFVTGINMYFISASFMGWTKNNNRTGD
ncbi:NRAMP family - like 2 [Theobroma cacao]|nr:NRAMP family - like 2 [Theobroma cacao]